MEVNVGVFLSSSNKSSSEFLTQTGQLVSYCRIYKLYIAAVSEARAEEASPETVLLLAPPSNCLGQCRFSSPRQAIDPQDRDRRGYFVLQRAISKLHAGPVEYGFENALPSGWRTFDPLAFSFKLSLSCVMQSAGNLFDT